MKYLSVETSPQGGGEAIDESSGIYAAWTVSAAVIVWVVAGIV
jgi:hypothetical protein